MALKGWRIKPAGNHALKTGLPQKLKKPLHVSLMKDQHMGSSGRAMNSGSKVCWFLPEGSGPSGSGTISRPLTRDLGRELFTVKSQLSKINTCCFNITTNGYTGKLFMKYRVCFFLSKRKRSVYCMILRTLIKSPMWTSMRWNYPAVWQTLGHNADIGIRDIEVFQNLQIVSETWKEWSFYCFRSLCNESLRANTSHSALLWSPMPSPVGWILIPSLQSTKRQLLTVTPETSAIDSTPRRRSQYQGFSVVQSINFFLPDFHSWFRSDFPFKTQAQPFDVHLYS